MPYRRSPTIRMTFAALLGLLGSLAGGPPARAQVPQEINFQGKLLDTSNNPRNGSFSLTFKIYNVATGGTALWSETQGSVNVANGVFAVELGSVTPIPYGVFSSSPTYLEITVGSEVGSPRQLLVTSPYAFTAQNAESAATAQSAQSLAPGATNYVQVTSSLQTGATFYVSSGTVGGPFTATGTVTLGGAAGVNDVTVASNLIGNGNLTVGGNVAANGAGPHVFAGNVQVKGNNLLDSGATSRVALGDPLLINAPTTGVGVPSGQPGILFSTSVFFNGTPSGDNYIAYPLQASTPISPGNVVIITGANTVGTTTTGASPLAIGFAVTSALGTGDTVWVAESGIVTEAVSNAAITIGSRVCTSGVAGQVKSCTTAGAPVGKALTGATAGGQQLSVMIYNGN